VNYLKKKLKTKSILIKVCQTAYFAETLQESKPNFETSATN